MMAANYVGGIRESAMHQLLLSPDEPLVVVVLQCGLVNTDLLYTKGMVTSPYYPNNIIKPVFVFQLEQHRPNFIFMNDNAPAYQGRIIREWLLETGVPGMQ
ncbi:hypothetical protein XENOCAPTIV_006675 [Xenoophorus captivus]|uniref:Uncharacterized protein n=1 Tax=Xenoophorus captivus TaxID=1517983 RepID=A0ABV0S8J3_9TELE